MCVIFWLAFLYPRSDGTPGTWKVISGSGYELSPTHWMSLPAPLLVAQAGLPAGVDIGG